LTVCLAACGVLLAASEPWTVDALLRIPSIGDPQIRPDGQAFAYTLRTIEGNTWSSSVYFAPIPSGKAQRVGAGSQPRWSPDSKVLGYLDGQVRVYDPAKRTARTVTHAATPVSAYAWAPDGRSIAYLAVDAGPQPDPVVADRDYRYARLYLQSLGGDNPRKLTTADRHVVSFALSPDGTRAVYAAQPTPRPREVFDVDLYELDLRTLAEKPLVTQPGRDGDPSYSPDGRWIAFHSQEGTLNFFTARQVALVPSGGGAIRYLTKGLDTSYDVYRGGNAYAWSRDGRSIYYTAGHSVNDFLVRQDLTTGEIDRVTDRIASAASFTPDLSRAVFLKTSVTRPPEIFLREGAKETRLTTVHENLASHPALRTKVVTWKSRDGLPVEGILYLPFRYSEGQRVPLLVELHGGPTGVILDSFPVPRTYPTQVFLEKGIAVFAPNFRGSINYGAEFRLKNVDSQGFGDFDDVMTGIDELVKQGFADPDRLGVMGWSYGGFLTAWVIGHTDRFKASSVGAPATDWITYYAQFDGSRSPLVTYFNGTPWENPAAYNRHSPRTGVANIHTPTMLQVGAQDINHNNEIYWSLTDRHVPVEYVVYPREGHGFVEPAHQRDLMERNLRWFTEWLK
ncbi:S9 family peptidase, partial [bacterium]